MTAAVTSKNPKCSIIRHIVWDNFEFAKEPNCSFSGVILRHGQGQNTQEVSTNEVCLPEKALHQFFMIDRLLIQLEVSLTLSTQTILALLDCCDD